VDVTVTARKAAPDAPIAFQSPKDWIGDLSTDAAIRAVAAAGDVAFVLDRQGVIRDVAVSARDLAAEGFADLRKRRWVDIVAQDSRAKVVDLLADAMAADGRAVDASPKGAARAGKVKPAGGSGEKASGERANDNEQGAVGDRPIRWREINHQTSEGSFVPLRFCALGDGAAGTIVAVGRDLRTAAAMQQRLLQVEQAMERDYARLRQSENRYRLLFHAIGEAVLVVDAGSRRIVEANPAAGFLLGVDHATLIGKPVSWFVAMESQETAAAAMMGSGPAARAEPVLITLAEGRGQARLMVTLMRHDRVNHMLIRLQPTSAAVANGAARGPLAAMVEKIPDAFVVADEHLLVLDANSAFLDLAQAPDAAAIVGEPLSRFLGRSGVDLSVLVQTLREHGWVRNFSTVVRTPFDASEGVDVSGVSAPHAGRTVFGFTMRQIARNGAQGRRDLEALPRSVEQLTDLIGRAPLKEIVRETTDIIERLCVEAALKLTGDNRASAAELLGLSRQSLYSKLHRFNIAGADNGEE
jgi:transcriptional regulator PpsR